MRRAVVAILLAASCPAAAARAEAPAPATFLPTPYSAEQIRDAWQPGRRVETRTSEAGDESRRCLRVLAADAEYCTIRSEALGPDGAVSGEASEFTLLWTALRDHARFEATKATRERAECRSALGSLPGWRYVTRDEKGDTVTLCFADTTPGPPAELEVQREGKLFSRTEHTYYGRPSGAEERR